MIQDQLRIAGAGGQGALRIGQIIAYAAVDKGWEAEWIPSYGAEMRGGTANCSVTIAEGEIPFGEAKNPGCLIVMNDLSLARFEQSVPAGGVIILNSAIIRTRLDREDIRGYYIPADTIAQDEGNPRGANMVMLGAYTEIMGRITAEEIFHVIDRSFTGDKVKYAAPNKKLVQRGAEYIAANYCADK